MCHTFLILLLLKFLKSCRLFVFECVAAQKYSKKVSFRKQPRFIPPKRFLRLDHRKLLSLAISEWFCRQVWNSYERINLTSLFKNISTIQINVLVLNQCVLLGETTSSKAEWSKITIKKKTITPFIYPLKCMQISNKTWKSVKRDIGETSRHLKSRIYDRNWQLC